MDIFHLIIGLFMIGLGFLVKSFPNLIAGYNTMTIEQKKNVDIKSLSSLMRNGLIYMGLAIIAGYFLFKWLGLSLLANSMILIAVLPGVTILIVNAQKYDHNKKKKTWLIYLILGLVFAFVIGIISYGFIPSKELITKEKIEFSGMYGIELNVSDIKNVELTDEIPAIKLRTNGYSFWDVNKGIFKLDKFGKCHLIMHSLEPPFIIITDKSDKRTIINFKEKTKTEMVYSKIQEVLGE